MADRIEKNIESRPRGSAWGNSCCLLYAYWCFHIYMFKEDDLDRHLTLAIEKMEVIREFREYRMFLIAIDRDLGTFRKRIDPSKHKIVEASMFPDPRGYHFIEGFCRWYDDLHKETSFARRVEETLNLEPEDRPEQIRAACFLLIKIGRPTTWPPNDLQRHVKRAIAKLRAIRELKEYQETPEIVNIIDQELLALHTRLDD